KSWGWCEWKEKPGSPTKAFGDDGVYGHRGDDGIESGATELRAGMTKLRAGMTVIAVVAGMTAVSFAIPAWAEWVKIGTTNMAVHYIDPATVRSFGNLRQVWLMQDMVEADIDGVRSVRALQELNCQDGRYRFLSVTAYS